ncbi:hypothetical protein [Haloechinothrix sp. LS1_15]|uniref:hypothetical protein n=1 Tax=Haloechinothrix sp. LS1_15 TaxID=2652248 RepID=UPI002945C5D8|nr:hypothetical protein [Haloechinothrix sp. LS1_15]MDV6013410.1 hypothetical protein [Haloechinothrix sp. LS1_15]
MAGSESSRQVSPEPGSDPRDGTAQPGAGAAAAPATALRRLLAVATLTPPQAALLAHDLADGLDELRSEGQPPLEFSDYWLQVTDSGDLVIDPSGTRRTDSAYAGETGTTQQDGEASTSTGPGDGVARSWRPVIRVTIDVINRLAACSRRDGIRRHDESNQLVEDIDEAEEDIARTAEQVRTAAARLLDESGQPTDRIRKQLVALIAAIAGHPPEPEPPNQEGPAPRAEPVPVRRAPGRPRLRGWRRTRRKAWHRRPKLRARWVIPVVALAALVAAGSWWGFPRAVSDLQQGWDALFTSESPPQHLAPVTQAPGGEAGSGGGDDSREEPGAEGEGTAAEPAEFERLAPESADPITAVDIEHLDEACEPGETCTVRVDVVLEREPAVRQVSWSLHIVDRCSGSIEEQPGMAVTAQSGWGQVYGISRPELPDGSALAVVAVTDEPARASSPPLDVPDDGGTC